MRPRRQLMPLSAVTNYIVTTFKYTTTSYTTILILGNSFNISQLDYIIVDGVKQEPVRTYYTNKEIEVIFHFKEPPTTLYLMFFECRYLRTIDGTLLDTSKVTTISNMLNLSMTDGVVNLSGWDLSNCTTISYFFYNTYLKHVDLSNWKFGKNVSLVGAFTVMGNLDGPFDLSSWKGTEYITDLGNAFNGCYVPINLNGWDTTNVRSFWATFIDCKEFTKEDINTCNATRMDSMFEKYAGDYVDCSDWENPKNTTLESMFYFANVKSVNMQNFKTSKVTTMKYMFVGCYYLMSLDLSSFDTSNVTNMYGMFCYDRSLESLDLSNFDITNVTDYNLMFYGCSSLKYIKCLYAFKEWCYKNKSALYLTDYWDNITWDIADIIPETKTYVESNVEKTTYTRLIGDSITVSITHTYSYLLLSGTTILQEEIEEYIINPYDLLGVFKYTVTDRHLNKYDVSINIVSSYISISLGKWESCTYDGIDTDDSYYMFRSKNKGVCQAFDKIRLTCFGYENIIIYINSYSRVYLDYTIASKKDIELTSSNYYIGANLMGTSYYYNKIPNNVNNYNKVIYSDFYNGFIDVAYRKNTCTGSYDDRGYLLIPKEYNIEIE